MASCSRSTQRAATGPSNPRTSYNALGAKSSSTVSSSTTRTRPGRSERQASGLADCRLHPRRKARHARSLRGKGSACRAKATGADKLYLAIAEGADDEAKKKAADKASVKVRKDGAAVDIDGDYTETLARIQSNPKGVGVFGLSFYENNTDKLKVATVGGITPSVERRSQPASIRFRVPLFFYVKKAHIGVIPGLKEYVEYFTSDKIIGEDGPLAEYGLVPLPADELKAVQEVAKDLKLLALDAKK